MSDMPKVELRGGGGGGGCSVCIGDEVGMTSGGLMRGRDLEGRFDGEGKVEGLEKGSRGEDRL